MLSGHRICNPSKNMEWGSKSMGMHTNRTSLLASKMEIKQQSALSLEKIVQRSYVHCSEEKAGEKRMLSYLEESQIMQKKE